MIVYYLFSTSAVLFVLLQMVHTATPLTPEETVQLHEGKQVKALEHALKVQYVKEVRRQLAECYKREGVNHIDNCKELVDAYWEAIGKKPKGPPDA